MKELKTYVQIDRSAEDVWAILTDFASYPEWNPFIRWIEGEPRLGASLRVRIEPPGGTAMTFRPRVVDFQPGRRLAWLGRLVVPRLVDGTHVFELHPLRGGAVRFVHREEFRGALVPLVWKTMGEKARRGFEAMNAAIKERAEREPPEP